MKLPKYLQEHIDFIRGENETIDRYEKGIISGMILAYKLFQEWEEEIESEAIKRAGKWFEEEVVAKFKPEEIYGGEIENKWGIPFISGVQDCWAYEFFNRVEMEKESLKDAYNKESDAEGADFVEGVGI